MLEWLRKRKWRARISLTASELAVVRALTPCDDPRSAKLMAQAENAPKVQRSLTDSNSYCLTIPYCLDSSRLIDLDHDLESPVLSVPEKRVGAKLEFRLKLLKGGFLYRLAGRAPTLQVWPMDWAVDDRALELAASQLPQEWLPPLMTADQRADIMHKLETWLSIIPGTLSKFDDSQLGVYRPRGRAALRAVEHRENIRLPAAIWEFAQITDGIELRAGRPLAIGRLEDIRRIEIEGQEDAFSVISDLFEEGLALMRSSGSDALVYHAASPKAPVRAVGTLPQHIVEMLKLLV